MDRVPLGALLERAGMEEDADQGTPNIEPKPPGQISYARSLPRDKAIQREVVIAYQMNGRDLPQDHGYPVRAIVPGHYGMASVKWLTRIYAAREPFEGYWQTSDYGYWDYLDRGAGAAHCRRLDGIPRSPQDAQRLRDRVAAELTTTFARNARATRIERNEAEVRNRPTECLRDARTEPGVHGFRRCMGGRDRGS
jgi:DMSO/TMAO reductase YedYZ molybdopterin-dependent catalytic subunit